MNTFLNAKYEGFIRIHGNGSLNARITQRGVSEQNNAERDRASWAANKYIQDKTGSCMTDERDFPAAKRLSRAQRYMRLKNFVHTH